MVAALTLAGEAWGIEIAKHPPYVVPSLTTKSRKGAITDYFVICRLSNGAESRFCGLMW